MWPATKQSEESCMYPMCEEHAAKYFKSYSDVKDCVPPEVLRMYAWAKRTVLGEL